MARCEMLRGLVHRDTVADLKPWRQSSVELFPLWFLNSRVRHAGLPRKAAVPPLGPIWPLPPIAGSELSPFSGSAHFNKTNSIKCGTSNVQAPGPWA